MANTRRLLPLHFPMAGMVERYAYQMRPPYSSLRAINMRPESVHQGDGATHIQGRERGGSRPGMAKFFAEQLGDASNRPVRLLNTVTYYSSGLKSRMVAVSFGKLYFESTLGALSLADTTGGTFNPTRVLHSAERGQKLYIADHSLTPADSITPYQPKKFDPVTNDITDWTAATAGTIPIGCECICLWRDRIVLAGGTTTPHGLQMSRVGDPEDWDYAATDAGGAVSLTLSDAGQIGDVVTCLSPHADNCMIIGCASSLWILRGDPNYGGSLDVLSAQLGVIDKGAFCVTPEGLMVFMSQDGLYMVPAQCEAARHPQSLGREKLPREMLGLDKSTTNVVLAYDVADRGIHIFLTPLTATGTPASHWWFDWESKSFWKVQLASDQFEPMVLHGRKNFYDDNSGVALGCRDGYVRRFTADATDDDGTDFDSELWLGPFGDPTMFGDSILTELMVTLAANSNGVNYEIFAGDDPTSAASNPRSYMGTWTAGRNRPEHPRVRGQSLYLKLTNANGSPWAWESGYAMLAKQGRTRS